MSDRWEAERDALLGLAMTIAHDKTYDSEYDGRNYTYCAQCDSEQGEDHDHDCPMLVARALLGEQWLEAEKKIEDQRRADSEAYFAKFAPRQVAAKVNCGICGKRVFQQGLSEHQGNNPKCLDLQAAKQQEQS